MSDGYNYIYSKIVQGEYDFVGHVAYSLYKQDKIEYITKFKNEHDGRKPTDEELEPFHTVTSSQNHMDAYRIKAESLLNEFVDDYVGEALDSIREQVKEEQLEVLKQVVKPLTPSYWSGVGQNLLASAIYTIIGAVIIFCLLVNAKGCGETVKDVSKGRVVIKEQSDSLNKGQ